MKTIPKCQNVIETKAVNVGPFFHIVHLLKLKLHVTLSEKRWGFPSVYVCRINYNVTQGRHHNTLGRNFVHKNYTVLRNFLVTLKMFLNAKCSLSQTINQSMYHKRYMYLIMNQEEMAQDPKKCLYLVRNDT